MPMCEAKLSAGQQTLLERFGEVGGCVDYVLLDSESAVDLSSIETHRRAAILGLEIIRDRFADYAVRTPREQGIPIEEIFAVAIDYERAGSMVGTRLSREEFLGPRYDLGQDRVIIPGGGPIPDGYAYAFSDPPYTLHDCARQRRVTAEEA